MDKLKAFWEKIRNRFENRPIDREPIPARVWFILCSFFFIGLVVTAGGVASLKIAIVKSEEGSTLRTTQSVAKIEQKKLEAILNDHDRRAADLLKYQKEKPAVVDPGV